MVIEHPTDQGCRELTLLYEPPFTHPADQPDRVFDAGGVMRKVATIRSFSEPAPA